MPTIYRHKGYRFFFFRNEGTPPEPPHIHVRHGERIVKFWLGEQARLADAWGMSSVELNRLEKIVQSKLEEFERAWHEYFG